MFATGDNLYSTMHDELLSEAQQELSDREYYIQQARRALAAILFYSVQLASWGVILYLTAARLETDAAIKTFLTTTDPLASWVGPDPVRKLDIVIDRADDT